MCQWKRYRNEKRGNGGTFYMHLPCGLFSGLSVSVLFRACLVLSVLTEMAGGRHYSILTKQITKVQIDTSVHSAFLDH